MNAVVATEHKHIKVVITSIKAPGNNRLSYTLDIIGRYNSAYLQLENAEELVILANIINDFINEHNLGAEITSRC